MELTRETIAGIVGGVVAVLLQIIVAPAIALAAAVPNFIVVFCVVRAVACPQQAGCVLPFVLGLLFDLMGGGPVGAMAFVLVLVTFLASRAFQALNNDTLFMPAVVLLAAIMLVEVLYGIIVVACGAGVSFGEAFLYRVLPCMLYDCVVGLLFYPIAIRVLVGKPLGQPGTPQLR
ncbi:rod shape-determining protein MreD [Adlercreutzia sp. R21]|uniref:Rod shape-determining protein MreD n=1 Tax=Adlercreutzia wanghongyangiae TaxID=3111451 RepID=A0ABU6IGC8_9ACTN|nr:rod shape-determining protein MreD [Adlercreutzia sp. R21]MEC4175462.1 rod shape-determining protein MreD [Adlercreutzia sp. R7]MEC4183315.1 rod shape-determining protein MreD [Adlercreutzia sp. R21]